MSIGQAIKGIKRGFEEAGAATRAMQEDERRQAIAKRDEERFNIEKDRATREAEAAKRNDQIRNDYFALEEQRKNGTGPFAELVTPGTEPAPEPAAPRSALPTGTAPEPAAPAAPKDPIAQTLDPKPMQRYGQNARKADEIFYDQLGSIMRRQFANNGDYAKAAVVDLEIKKLKESGYDAIRKSAMAAVVSGVDGSVAEPALSKAYETLNDGMSIKPGSVKFDPKSKKYSMVITDGKKDYAQTYDQMSLAAVLQQADPLKVLEWNVSRADKDRDYALDVRRTVATETSAKAALEKARADGKAADAALKGADQKARTETLNSFFPNADKSLTMEERVSLGKDGVAQFESRQQAERMARGDAERLISLNPSADVRVVVQAARDANAKGGFSVAGSENGRPFTMIGNQKIYLK